SNGAEGFELAISRWRHFNADSFIPTPNVEDITFGLMVSRVIAAGEAYMKYVDARAAAVAAIGRSDLFHGSDGFVHVASSAEDAASIQDFAGQWEAATGNIGLVGVGTMVAGVETVYYRDGHIGTGVVVPTNAAPGNSNSLAGQATGAGAGVATGYPFAQECDESCWAASSRNYLHESGIANIPTEARIRGDVADAMLADAIELGDIGAGIASSGVRAGTRGISRLEAKAYLLPVLAKYGVPSQVVKISMFHNARSEFVFASYIKTGVPIMAKLQPLNQGGHVVMFRQDSVSPTNVLMVDPRGGALVNSSGPDAFRNFTGELGADRYLVVPQSARPPPAYMGGPPGW
ncbi:MAG TPA: hypothetical protein VK171_09205, partial [Fimbriimonas sp.]|nr:hypothetical protein [Fimbriimonas sp.]